MASTQAARASSLVNFLGVNTHIDFQQYGYQNLSAVEEAIDYLGVKVIRDDPENPADVGAGGWWQQVASATGAKFDAFLAEGSPSAVATSLTLSEEIGRQGILSAIEGPNEEDDPYALSSGNNLNIAAGYMGTVHAAAQSLGLPTINMSFGQGWTAANDWHGDYDKVGNLAGVANYANAHTYPGTSAPANSLSMLHNDALIAAPGRPVINTEFGYDTSAVSAATAAKYDLDAIFDSLSEGDAGLYFYALFNDGSGNFGLMNANGSPNAEGVAIHDLTTLLADDGANAGSFGAGALNYTLGGTQGGDNSYLFEKSDGTYWLGLWNEQQGLGAAHNVTLTLGSSASRIVEYDPLTGTSAVQTLANASSATISVPDHPVLVEIVPSSSSASSSASSSTSSSSSSGSSSGGSSSSSSSSGSPSGGGSSGGDSSSSSSSSTSSSSSGGSSSSSSSGPNDLALAVPASDTVSHGTASTISGISASDPWGVSNGGGFALNVYDQSGSFTLGGTTHGPGGGKVAGGMVNGSLATINADLASLAYTPGGAGSDTLTVDLWNPAGVEVTRTIHIDVSGDSSSGNSSSGGSSSGNTSSGNTSSGGSAPAGGGGSTQAAQVVVPAGQSTYYAIVSNETVSASGSGQFIFLGGTGDTLTATGGSDTIQAFSGGSAITTGGGGNKIFFGGTNNTIDAGAGSNTLYDSGSNSTIALAPGGNDTIYGYVLMNGDKLDLRGLLSTTKWDGSTATLSQYLGVSTSNNSAVLTFNQAGTGGASGSAVATLVGSGPASLSTLLAHAIT